VVVVSAAVNVVHTASHAGQHIMSLPLWQLAFIALVIFATPVVAAVLLWTRYRVTGAWLLVASMAGSLVFGLLYHFLVPGSDNVFAQPPGTWRSAFAITAVLLSLLQATGVVVGLRVARGTPEATTEEGSLEEYVARLDSSLSTAFLLREVFGHDHAEVTSLVGESEAARHQVVRRAKWFVAARRPGLRARPSGRINRNERHENPRHRRYRGTRQQGS
jgi:hypothetical protein